MDADISPPPSKRRRLMRDSETSETAPNEITERRESANAQYIWVYSWNINGIKPFLQSPLTAYFKSSANKKLKPTSEASPASIREFLRRHQWPQILCLQEIKIGPSDDQVLRALKRAVNIGCGSNEPTYEVFANLPRDPFNAQGPGSKRRIYGVACVVRSDFHGKYVSRVRTVDWDAEGRFAVIEIHDPTTDAKLSIWNVYAVNGTSSEYRDPRTGEVAGTRHDRKLAVHKLMMEECLKLEREGWSILIIGDLNVAPSRIDGHPNLREFPRQHVINREDFNTRFLEPGNVGGFRGIDVWRALRGTERKYTYYPRSIPWGSSCDRVDLAIASRNLMSVHNNWKIVGCEIWNTKQERGSSDHCPISVTIKTVKGADSSEGAA
ncbi:uncharacterized protein PV09_04211 [Verruconis gallopava]|uniref:Endonuclease/exonuclease/phosphatase domain-containing protein n=1 Tax=Verruconis gallopava TaxID=253628 RepID=A0A0D1XQX4_9PEZI|nr:uncharacterized protein PV09_04211 [Verruconis gallopava]KIW05056.1 hypothetical protein PV09_04211 [Verruconis gallopava]